MVEATSHRLSMSMVALVVPVVAAVTAVVTLVATSPRSSAPVAGAGRDAAAVTIQDFAFSPPTLRVAAGTTVKVTNADGARHTLTAVDGTFDTGTLGGGAHATVTIERPGRHRYYCDIHNYMTGRIEAT
jgi:plastocyanin